jgi:undecaprenyl-diphosphatase
MRELLYQLDVEALRWLNLSLSNPGMDHFWLFITQMHKQPVIAFGLFPVLLLALFYAYKGRVLRLLAAVGLAIAATDLLSYRVVKGLVQRARPFEQPQIAVWLRHVGTAHGPSFPSNHAANCFAAAAVLAWYFPPARKFFYTLALLVALSRVALGVHYPSDVLVGAMLGFFVGVIVRARLLNQYNWFSLEPIVSKPEVKSGNWRTRSRRLAED